MYLLPVPHQMDLADGNFIIKYDTKLMLDSKCTFQETHYAKLIQKDVSDILSFDLSITKADKADENSIFLRLDETMEVEHYHISIEECCVCITGGDTSGLLYGVQTLRQIISQQGAIIPCLKIEDYPDIPNRGFYHDVTRGRMPKLETLKALADGVSYYKMNQLQLYVEHSFLFKDFSEVWRDDTPLTAEEIIELDEYCQALNIELVPSIACFGHLHKVLLTKTYSHLCEIENPQKEPFTFIGRMLHHTVDVTNPESFEMIKKMILEFIPLFTSKKFNICADETFDLGKGKSKPLADKVGVHRIYVDFVSKLCAFVKEQGKQPMFWGDIIVGSPELIKELPEDIICLNWGYSPDESEDNTKLMHSVGATQYLCPGVQGWKQFLNRNDYAYQNITRMCSYAVKYDAVGLLNTDWGDYGHINFVRGSTTGMIYGAAFSWNKEQLDYDTINRMVSVIAYGDKTESFVDIVSNMSKSQSFNWDNAVRYMEAGINKLSDNEITEYFGNFKIENAAKANADMAILINRLYGIMMSMEQTKRELVKENLIMAKAIIIFNNIGSVIKNARFNGNGTVLMTAEQAAVALEYWWNDFKGIWRDKCKEGELFRIQNVVFWYADLLRTL